MHPYNHFLASSALYLIILGTKSSIFYIISLGVGNNLVLHPLESNYSIPKSVDDGNYELNSV
jgi:hypothetical protein